VAAKILKEVGALINETLLVADDVGVVDGGEDAYLVQCVLLLAFVEVVQLDLLDRVDLVVDEAFGLVDAGVGALA
jgi:hypothetical protein